MILHTTIGGETYKMWVDASSLAIRVLLEELGYVLTVAIKWYATYQSASIGCYPEGHQYIEEQSGCTSSQTMHVCINRCLTCSSEHLRGWWTRCWYKKVAQHSWKVGARVQIIPNRDVNDIKSELDKQAEKGTVMMVRCDQGGSWTRENQYMFW